MKLTQNMKPLPRPKQPNFQTPTRQLYSYPYSSSVSPSPGPSSTQNLNLNLNLSSISSAHRFNQQPGAYSARSSNSKQLFPYDNDIVYSQVSDRIHQFSGGSLMLQNKDRDGLRDNYEFNRSYDDVNLIKQGRGTSQNAGSSKLKIQESSYTEYEDKGKHQKNSNKNIGRMSSLNINNPATLDELNNKFEQRLNQHKNQTANSIREAIIKVNQNLKKQCMIQFSRQFLPLSYMDEMDRKFEEVAARIGKIQQNNYKSNPLQNKNSNISELKLQILNANILHEQFHQNFKTQLQSMRNQLSMMGDSIKKLQIKQQILDSKSTATQLQQQIRQRFKVNQLENNQNQFYQEIAKLKQALRTVRDDQDVTLGRLKKLESSSLNRSVESVEGNRTIKHDMTKKQNMLEPTNHDDQYRVVYLKQSSNTELENPQSKTIRPLSPTITSTTPDPTPFQKLKSMSFTYSTSSFGDVLMSSAQKSALHHKQFLVQSLSSLKQIRSSKYILDNQNHLMDDTGNYILDQDGKQIKLNQDQIQILKQSNIVKYKEQK